MTSTPQTDVNQFYAKYAYVLRSLYRAILHTEVSEETLTANLRTIKENNIPLESVISDFLNSPQRHEIDKLKINNLVDTDFHTPTALKSDQPETLRALLLGSCMMDNWKVVLGDDHAIDHIPLNHFPVLPESPPAPVTSYNFQIVQLPLRSIIPDNAYISLDYRDVEAFNRLLERSVQIMELMVEKNLKWNIETGLLTFVCNFFTPQQNFIGRFGSHEDLRNPIFFIERLNSSLANILDKFKNTYILDLEKLSRIYGKKYIQEDPYLWLTHQGLAADYDDDQHRIETPQKYSRMHPTTAQAFIKAAWNEAVAMHRSVNGTDNIKLVIIDLDDTLWRGTAAEGALESFGPRVLEGWPIGFIEALHWLKSRGVILAIASKNNEDTIKSLWSEMTRDLIGLDDFAVHRINWDPKVENVKQIMKLVNVLPKSTLFIDDNPLERETVALHCPGIRTLGKNLYDIRRTLLWAPELQTPFITEESAKKTEMLRAQVEREDAREKFSRDDFLKSLNLEVSSSIIKEETSTKFARCFELLNKTNQFNTTGQRWKPEDMQRLLEQGGYMIAISARDKFTDYGLISVIVILEDVVEQFVMSCRVFGLDIEFAALSIAASQMRDCGFNSIKAKENLTEFNLSSREIFKSCGFAKSSKVWRIQDACRALQIPDHISVRP